MTILKIVQDYLREQGITSYMCAATGVPSDGTWVMAKGHLLRIVDSTTIEIDDRWHIDMNHPKSLPDIRDTILGPIPGRL